MGYVVWYVVCWCVVCGVWFVVWCGVCGFVCACVLMCWCVCVCARCLVVLLERVQHCISAGAVMDQFYRICKVLSPSRHVSSAHCCRVHGTGGWLSQCCLVSVVASSFTNELMDDLVLALDVSTLFFSVECLRQRGVEESVSTKWIMDSCSDLRACCTGPVGSQHRPGRALSVLVSVYVQLIVFVS